MGQRLAYCPTDARQLLHYRDELLRLDLPDPLTGPRLQYDGKVSRVRLPKERSRKKRSRFIDEQIIGFLK